MTHTPPAWLNAYRSPIKAIQTAAQRAARITSRYASDGRRVPPSLYNSYRSRLSALIEQHHHAGDMPIRAARFAIDALDANQTAPACICGGILAPEDKHDHPEYDAVCGECCQICAAEDAAA